ncbi:MAG: putative sulfate/molybdate transporter, partial [Candidatus Hydrothermarchaeaceae archaeon]
MRFGSYSFDRVEFAGSLGDLGTLVPLSVALIAINGLNATAVFLMVGLFYIVAGAYYKLPIPVQPLKVVAAIAIASKLDAATIAASGYLMGIVLIFIGVTGIVDTLARFFTKPIVRGIQLGLGLILINKAVAFIEKDELFINGTPSYLGAVSVNTLVGVIGALIVLVLLTSRRLPAAIAVLVFGLAVGILTGALSGVNFSPGYEPLHLMMPNSAILLNALVLLVIPQIPLTIGNAVMGTCDAANTLFGRTKASKSTVRALS